MKLLDLFGNVTVTYCDGQKSPFCDCRQRLFSDCRRCLDVRPSAVPPTRDGERRRC